MFMIFLSESGLTGAGANDPNQPHHVHAGLLVRENQYISMCGEYDALVRRHFGSPPGGDGAPAEISPRHVYQGTGPFRAWRPEKRAELIQDCLSILIRRETPLIVSYINREEYANAAASEGNPLYGHSDPSRLAFSRFLLALTMFLDENVMSQMNPDDIMQSVWQVNDYAMLMPGSKSASISAALTEFMGEESDTVAPSIYDDILVAPPDSCVGSQLVNICAYFVRRWLQQPDAPHSYFEALRDGRVVQVIYPYSFD